jgi:hypothetical protein
MNPNISGNGNPSPTISEVLRAICDQLATYATPRGGTVKVVENESHLWEEIYNDGLVSEQPRIMVLFVGEVARGEYAGGERTKLHRVDRKFMVVVMRGHGFKNMAVESRGQPGTPGFYESFADSIETIRDGCRVMSNISVEDVVDYKGIRPLSGIGPSPSANVFLDCKAIEFACASDIPEILCNGTTG